SANDASFIAQRRCTRFITTGSHQRFSDQQIVLSRKYERHGADETTAFRLERMEEITRVLPLTEEVHASRRIEWNRLHVRPITRESCIRGCCTRRRCDARINDRLRRIHFLNHTLIRSYPALT